jgi:UTP--glucose-1-phosphate uridylyltransferase
VGRDAVAVVEAWHAAVNAGDAEAAVALAAPDVEVGGPRGSGRGPELLRAWVGQAGIRLEPLRTLAAEGTVVVEQRARWREPGTGALGPEQRVTSVFVVVDGAIVRILRFADVDDAVAAAGLEAAAAWVPCAAVSAQGLERSTEKMRREGVGDAAIQAFADAYERLQGGETGVLPEAELEPVDEIPDADELPEADAGEALDRAVVIKLNGGLGTSMGMTGPKSLVEVKDGLTFLDIIVHQVLGLRERSGARVPLVLMNSFSTRDASLQALERHDGIRADVPLDFVQNKVPKLLADGLEPAEWPDDPALEWAPPGHGDLYAALVTSGMLDELLDRGYRYAFVSNADNLGAVLDPRILAWVAAEEVPFAMEVADRTEVDRKGGHVARRRDGGGLVLREIAQTPDEDVDAFQDVSRHRFFNTNTLWVDLEALRGLLDKRDGVLGLPMIVNRKTVDPSDKGSPEVVQLETAMGAAIDVFDGARALRVPRTRFAPVKTTNDLLALRSDAYLLTEDARVVPAEGRDGPPLIELDDEHFKLLRDFESRFPAGAPSLVACRRLRVSGDVRFGAGVVVRGSVAVEHDGDDQLRIEDGAVLEG